MWEQHDWARSRGGPRGRRGEPERLRYEYRWWSGETGVEDHPMPAVLVVEGIRLFSDRTRDWFDLTVWVDMDPDSPGAGPTRATSCRGTTPPRSSLGHQVDPRGLRLRAAERPHERADLVIIAAR